ncbi:hypothetical protein Ancab_004342, partial [Ancistrocladus abbreviatus]
MVERLNSATPTCGAPGGPKGSMSMKYPESYSLYDMEKNPIIFKCQFLLILIRMLNQVVFDDRSHWEYLFKDYWIEQKEKLCVTSEELAQAKNPWKECDADDKQETPAEIHEADVQVGNGSDSSFGNVGASSSKNKKNKKRLKASAKEKESDTDITTGKPDASTVPRNNNSSSEEGSTKRIGFREIRLGIGGSSNDVEETEGTNSKTGMAVRKLDASKQTGEEELSGLGRWRDTQGVEQRRPNLHFLTYSWRNNDDNRSPSQTSNIESSAPIGTTTSITASLSTLDLTLSSVESNRGSSDGLFYTFPPLHCRLSLKLLSLQLDLMHSATLLGVHVVEESYKCGQLLAVSSALHSSSDSLPVVDNN